MAYCVEADVTKFAPQLINQVTDEVDADVNVAGHIASADTLIDARLRAKFEVPFTSPDGLITTISAKLAAASALKAQYSKVTGDEPSKYASQLQREAEDAIAEIIESPSLLSQTVRTSTPDGGDKSTLVVTQGGRRHFNMGRPEGWK